MTARGGEETRPAFPARLESPSGLTVLVNENGSVRRMDRGDLVVNLFMGSEVEGGPANIYLRRLDGDIAWTPLLGPRSPSAFRLDGGALAARAEWRGVRIGVSLALARTAAAWFWHVALENAGPEPVELDLIYAQDVALAPYGAVRLNEYYVSQYLDHTPLAHARHGAMLAVRQNLAAGGRHPWALIGSLGRGASFATDALQLHGLATRAGRAPEALLARALPGRRRQHEHSMAAIQDAAVRLMPGESAQRGFFGWLEDDHPAATSDADLAVADRALALPEAAPPGAPGPAPGWRKPAATLFTARPHLESLDLSEPEVAELFGAERRHAERDDGGRLLSFFTGRNRHVVLRAKELAVLRPHGHIVRTGAALTPDEASLTSTMWMGGVFNSMLTQGHVSINRFLSTSRSYLGLLRAPGQRVFVETGDGFRLLDVPSAFQMDPNGGRWIYKHAGGVVAVSSRAALSRHAIDLAIEVLSGAPARFLISHHVALHGDDGADGVPALVERDGADTVVRPSPDGEVGRRFPAGFFRIAPDPRTRVERVGGDELLFDDGRSRRQPYVVIVTAPAARAHFTVTGGLIPSAAAPPGAGGETGADEDRYWHEMSGALELRPPAGSPLAGDVARLGEMLPWLAHDALIHYLAPRGLEQFSGGGWGTRDVAQGPVELLLSLGRWEPMRDLLLRVFAAQNADGDWPQWFMFFPREAAIRPGDSHGDIVFWPLLALAEYLLASDDASVLDEVAPFYDPAGPDRAERASVWAHVERALAVIGARVIPGTQLAAYGHGDWNDSLQPADPALRERLSSAWTVTLHCQTLTALAAALARSGRAAAAAPLEAGAARVRADFQRLLVVDGTLAGFAHFQPGGAIDYLLHPRDATTGIRYSLLAMVHAIINDLLTPGQARAHADLIARHLLGPDGARLFDRPPTYRGGPETVFQRAESSTFFGREIGIMYVHAHLRYAESMARRGDAEAFFLALRQAVPIAIRSAVPTAAPRQANCYYSSSDAAFDDRYEAQAHYDRVRAGAVALEGGWRVYSSGAGISVRLILERFLGLRQTRSALLIDPVMPPALDGLEAERELGGARFRIVYRVGAAGCGPAEVRLNGEALPFARTANPYRVGGAEVRMADLSSRLNTGVNELLVRLG